MSTTNDKDPSGRRIPALSVVMPVYNAVEFIGEAIESVMTQTFTDWELVAVNDSSTDSSAEIIRRYMALDSRIRLVEMPAQSGSAFAPRCRAVAEALAPVVSPLDADDFVAPDYLERLMRRRAETGAQVVYPSMYRRQASGDWSLLIPDPTDFCEKVFAGRDTVRFTLDEWQINCNGGVIDRELFLRAAELTRRELKGDVGRAFSDEVFGRLLLFISPLVAFCGAAYYYRENITSITQKASLKSFEYLYSNRQTLRLITELYSEEDAAERILAQRHVFHGVISAIRRLGQVKLPRAQRREVYSQIRLSVGELDMKLLRRLESPVYYHFLHTFYRTPGLAGVIMRIGDRIHPPTPRQHDSQS